MPYVFGRDGESVESGLRRLAQSQLGQALDALGESGRPVPDRLRESCRALGRVRSLMGLVGAAFPDLDRESEALDGASRLIEGVCLRADRLATFHHHESFLTEALGGEAVDALRARLKQDLGAHVALPDVAGQFIQFRVALLSAWERAGAWSLSADGRDALTGGLARAYGAAQTAMEAARQEGEPAFSDWRKAVAEHRDHARLFEHTVPGPVAAHLAMADVLSESLDDHRDLVCLEELLEMVPDGADMEAAREIFAALRSEIVPSALALGTALLAEPPEGLARRFATYFEISRDALLDTAQSEPAPRAIAAL